MKEIRRASAGAVVTCIEKLMEPSDHPEAISDPDDRYAGDVGQSIVAHAAMRDAWRRGRARRWPLREGAPPLMLGEWRLEILHPSEAEVEAVVAQLQSGGDPNLNDVSAALLVEHNSIRLVLAADGERAAWEAIQSRIAPYHLRAVRPLKVPHHGSLNAIHPVLIDPGRASVGREQVVTPFPQSGRLPRFEPGQGAERLLESVRSLHLTAMPGDLLPTKRSISLAEVQTALEPVDFAGDDELQVHRQRPAARAPLEAGRRDPRECWVVLGVQSSGAISVTHGMHAVDLV